MTSIVPFDPRRFRSAAEHYLAGRPPYPPQLIEHVVGLCGVTAADRVLDLGCGPAQLARALAPFAREVVAVDPEPEMLALARQLTLEAGQHNLSFVQGSSYSLEPDLGRFKMAAIGRAFHWMDREDALRRLDGIIEAGGAVVLFEDEHPKVPDNAWRQDFEMLIDRYGAVDPSRRQRKSADWVKAEAVLLDSAFPDLLRIGVIEKRPLQIDDLIQRAFSRSGTTRARLGAQADQLAADIRDVIGGKATNGTVIEVVETNALIARRA
ncbi:MAG: class I SAM-dependent methyltransferase [Dongiaceae bacterium]